MALRAGLNHAVGRTAAITLGAVLDSGGGDLLLTAEGGFLKGQFQAGHNVLAPAGCILTGTPAACTAAAAEELTENVPKVAKTAKSAAETAAESTGSGSGPGTKVGIHTGKAVLVVALALLLIGKHLVGLSCLLELFLGFLVAGVAVGVILHGGLAVGPLYFIGAGGFVYPQHLIVITFVICHILLLN